MMPGAMNLRILLCSALTFLLAATSCKLLDAQEINENNFTLYTKQQGLSQSSVMAIAQDSTGYLWVGTNFGLNRFNGNNFVQFHSTKDSLSLPAESISRLVWLNSYKLGVLTWEGLHIIDTRNGQTRNLLIPYVDKQYQYKFNGILAVRTNSAGDIFIVTRSGFYHFDRNYHLVYRFDYYSKEQVIRTPFGFGRGLLCLDDRRFVMISSNGLYFYDVAQKQLKKMDSAVCPEFAEF